MTFRKIKWPKSEEEPKLGVGGVCHGDAVPLMYRSRPPQCQTVVQPLKVWYLVSESYFSAAMSTTSERCVTNIALQLATPYRD